MIKTYPANPNGSIADPSVALEVGQHTLFNGETVTVFDNYEEYLEYLQQTISPQE